MNNKDRELLEKAKALLKHTADTSDVMHYDLYALVSDIEQRLAEPDCGEWVSTKNHLPEKPGLRSYEHVWCLIYIEGEIRLRPWNCEHLVWDDESGDDFEYHPQDPTHWQPLPQPPEATK